MESGKGEPRRVLVVRPIGHPVPGRWIAQRIGVPKIPFVVAALSLMGLQSLEMGAQGLAKKRRPIRFQLANRSVRGPQEIGLQDDLDRFHMWNLLHIEFNINPAPRAEWHDDLVGAETGPRGNSHFSPSTTYRSESRRR